MINAAHVLLYSGNAEADRAFFRDVLKLPSVDAGHGWLIFKLPPSELAVHPADDVAPAQNGDAMIGAVIYLMCEDLEAVIASLAAKKIWCRPVSQERWGSRTSVRLPSGAEIGLYKPTHPTAYDLA